MPAKEQRTGFPVRRDLREEFSAWCAAEGLIVQMTADRVVAWFLRQSESRRRDIYFEGSDFLNVADKNATETDVQRSGFNLLPIIRTAFARWCDAEGFVLEAATNRLFAWFIKTPKGNKRLIVVDGAKAVESLKTFETADKLNDRKAASTRARPRGCGVPKSLHPATPLRSPMMLSALRCTRPKRFWRAAAASSESSLPMETRWQSESPAPRQPALQLMNQLPY